jgi:uncharacterized metal-binding protein
MPCGVVHDRITVVGAVLAAPAWWYLLPASPHDLTAGALLVGATLFSGLMLSPDLDLVSGPYHRWGPFRYIWWPYQKVIPHRSPLSHSLIVGPALRIAYFLFMLWALFRGVTYLLDALGITHINRNALSAQYSDAFVGFWRAHPYHLEMCVLGILFGTALHVGADLIVTACKPKHRHRRR